MLFSRLNNFKVIKRKCIHKQRRVVLYVYDGTFYKNSEQLLAVDYSHKKAPSKMLEKILD